MAKYLNQWRQAYQAQQVIWLISGLIIALLLWAAFASIDEVVNGQGSLVPSSSVQKVQSLDGGILRQLHVQEGDKVALGQALVTLDETRAKASFAEAQSEQIALTAKRQRLLAELASSEDGRIQLRVLQTDAMTSAALSNEAESLLASISELQGRVAQADQDIIQQQRELAEAQQNLLTLQFSLQLLDDEIQLTSKAVDSGALSAAELRKMERERVSVAGKIDGENIKLGKLRSMVTESQGLRSSVFDEFRNRARKELADTDARLARLEQMLAGLGNQLEQTRLTAARAGTIKSIALPSIGGVVRPAETIMEIVPEGDSLLVEAKVAPKDIGLLRKDQTAVVKFSAYDFVIHGGIRGSLKYISPDAITDEEGRSYFIVHVEAESGDWQQGSWQDKPLIPGMQAEVDILSGKKTILAYWLKPLLRAKANALREP